MLDQIPALSAQPRITVDTPHHLFEVRSLGGTESLGRLYEYRAELASVRPIENLEEELLGQPLNFRIQLPSGSERHLDGIVRYATEVGANHRFHRYEVTVVPQLWFLTQTTDCRIFESRTVPEIVTEILTHDHGIGDVRSELIGEYPSRTYCVQYRETDFSFVSRLLEEEGIYYYFEHGERGHTLVLADSRSAHTTAPECPVLTYSPGEVVFESEEILTEIQSENTLGSDQFAHASFDFTKPRVQLRSGRTAENDRLGLEAFDYPGPFLDFEEGERYARVRMEELRTERRFFRGQTPARGLANGQLFTAIDLPGSTVDFEMLVLETSIYATSAASETEGNEEGSGFSYSCRLKAAPAEMPFRPKRTTPKPIIPGPQTAFVVAPQEGPEIWTDKHGRVRVEFHWDREKKLSCWARVAQLWAGREWGSFFLPRVGHEVVVEFMEGNPDRPLVTGSVYNEATRPPYKLPEEATKSGIRTHSTPRATGFNELTFEDADGKEEIFVHGERNLRTVIKAFESRRVGASRSSSIGKDDTLTVKRDQTINIEEGDRTINVAEGDQTLNVREGDLTTNVSEGDVTLNVSEGSQTTNILTKDKVENIHRNREVTVSTGNSTETVVEGNSTLEVQGGNRVLHVQTGNEIERIVSGNHETTLNAGTDRLEVLAGDRIVKAPAGIYQAQAKAIEHEGTDSVTLRCGKASLTLSSDGSIVIEGSSIVLKENAMRLSSMTVDKQGVTTDALNVNSKASGKNTIIGTRIDLNP